jgi:enoyl-CoA hydratase/carnithine racemase
MMRRAQYVLALPRNRNIKCITKISLTFTKVSCHTLIRKYESSTWLQGACTAFETISKPVIATVHGACVGAGIDIITACDIRICESQARFCVKEVDLGIAADMGTLQRLPGIIGEGRARHLALSACTINAQHALNYGLVTEVVEGSDALLRRALALGAEIAGKPMLAVEGTKHVMAWGRGRPIQDGLKHVATWNSATLWSHDVKRALDMIRNARAKL